MLSLDQSRFYSAAMNGHSILLTGQGGSGKTFVLKTLAKDMRAQNKHVAITCSTGISATQYEGGQTLHRWSGFGDGSISRGELLKLISVDERYAGVRQRLLICNILFIDECSMISEKMFETVELICRQVRGNDSYFGGIQVIISGDFFNYHQFPMNCMVSLVDIALSQIYFQKLYLTISI